MAAPPASDAKAFRVEGTQVLDEIRGMRDDLAGLPGVLNGELERFRDRTDRLIRESEVDNWRQVRIFVREVDAIAADLAKAASEQRLSPKHILVLDQTLRKARKRDFYGARKAWRKLDKIASEIARLRGLQAKYRDLHRSVEGRVHGLRLEAERLSKIPKPPTSAADAQALIAEVDAFNEAATASYMDFLARARSDIALPLLLEASQGGGIGIPAPPRGSDPEPLFALMADPDPTREILRARSFHALRELPGYSDAKLAHLMGDARLVRRALEAAWPWLKAVAEEEPRSLRSQWTDDISVLKVRLPAASKFLSRIGAPPETLEKAESLVRSLDDGRFERLQAASRLYGRYGEDAASKWRGDLDGRVQHLTGEAEELSAALKSLPEPSRVDVLRL